MICVVIPARDEEQLIARCLESVLVAAANIREATEVIVVADGCLDRTAAIARGFGVVVEEIESSNVGAARAHGAALAVERGARWIANTDADSVVPPTWLGTQVRLELQGADVVVGTVRPDFAELAEDQVTMWSATHILGKPNGHVHGANLGLRASAYLAVGGYRALPEHEDADLVARLADFTVVASDEHEVITSARRFGRTPGGYARYLREGLLSDPTLERNARDQQIGASSRSRARTCGQ